MLSHHVRLIRYVLRMVVLLGVLLIITEQYLEPTIANSLVPLRQLNWPHMIGAMHQVLDCLLLGAPACYPPQQCLLFPAPASLLAESQHPMMSTCVRHFTRHMLRCGSSDECA